LFNINRIGIPKSPYSVRQSEVSVLGVYEIGKASFAATAWGDVGHGEGVAAKLALLT